METTIIPREAIDEITDVLIRYLLEMDKLKERLQKIDFPTEEITLRTFYSDLIVQLRNKIENDSRVTDEMKDFLPSIFDGFWGAIHLKHQREDLK